MIEEVATEIGEIVIWHGRKFIVTDIVPTNGKLVILADELKERRK